MENWNPEFPLLLGNEKSGERVWNGTISNILFLDRTLSDDEVEEVFLGEVFQDRIASDVLAYFKFDVKDALVDRSETLPNFVNRGRFPLVINHDGVHLGEEQWLETNASILNDRIRQSSQFTLIVDLQADQKLQTGPARIVSISNDAFQRNLTLGQEGDDLIIRVRSPITGANGRNPELVVPDVFKNRLAHLLVLSYQPDLIRAYVDNQENLYRFPLTPISAFFYYLFPKTEQIHMAPVSPFLLNLAYFGMLSVPIAISIVLFANHYALRKTTSGFL